MAAYSLFVHPSFIVAAKRRSVYTFHLAKGARWTLCACVMCEQREVGGAKWWALIEKQNHVSVKLLLVCSPYPGRCKE